MKNDNTAPLVSVVMAAYNAQNFVEAAIESVIAQTMTDWELIIVDDGSYDSTYSRAEALAERDERIHLLRNEVNSGVAITRNTAINRAQGKYIAFIDSDDVWHSEKLERQLAKVADTGSQICYCSCSIIDHKGLKLGEDYIVPESVGLEDLLKENYLWCSAVLVETEQVRKFMFNTEYYHEDYVLMLQLLKSGCRACGCCEVLLEWRYLEKSRSFNKLKSAGNRWKIYRGFMELSLLKSAYYFANYTIAGLRKYSGICPK